MPTKTRASKPRRLLSLDKVWLELLLGPDPRWQHFRDDEDRRQHWFAYKAEMLESFGNGGKRPWAWWRFEANRDAYPRDACSEADALYRMNVLSAAERELVERGWELDWATAAMKTRGLDDLLEEAARLKIPRWWIIKTKVTDCGEYVRVP